MISVTSNNSFVTSRYQSPSSSADSCVDTNAGWLGGGEGKPGEKKVEFEHDFYLGKYEVTQEEWEKVTGLNLSTFTRKNSEVNDVSDDDLKRFPVDKVSWDDCQVFLKRLNKQANERGWVYRLPAEAEWEYACRGGPIDKLESAFDYYFKKPTINLDLELAGNDRAADPTDKSKKRASKVGSFPPNRLGSYDMHGNVQEWCVDVVASDANGQAQRILRGGNWNGLAQASSRSLRDTVSRVDGRGLRLIRVRAEISQLSSLKPEFKPIPVGQSPFDKLDPAAIPAEERFEWQPKELVAVIGNHARRHWNWTLSTAISSDGKLAATGASVGEHLIVWDLETQQPIRRVNSRASWLSDVTALQFSKDNTKLFANAFGNGSGVFVLEHSDASQPFSEWMPIRVDDKSVSQWFNQRGRYGVMLEDANTYAVWDYGGGAATLYSWNDGAPKMVTDKVAMTGRPAFAVSVNKMFYTSVEGKLRRATIKDGMITADVEIPIPLAPKQWPLAARNDGQRVLLRAANKVVELWDIAGDSPKKTMAFGDIPSVISLSADGRWMTDSYNTTRLWRIDGHRAIVGSDNGFVRFWDLSGDTPKELSPPNLTQAFRPPGYTRPQLDPRTGRLMLHTYDTPKPNFSTRSQLWDFSASAPRPYPAADVVLDSPASGPNFPLASERWLNVGRLTYVVGHHTYSIRDRAWQSVAEPFGMNSLSIVSPDGSWLFSLTGGKPGEYAIEGWDVSQDPVKKWTIPFDSPYPLNPGYWKFLTSHDGSLFAVAHGDQGGELTLFRHHGDRAEKFNAIPIKLSLGLSRAALSPDGGWLVHYSEANGGPVVIADIRTGKAQELARKHLGYVRWLTFSPDGQRVAYATDSRVGVLDAKTLAPLYEWKSPGNIDWLDFAPDARHLITLNGNHTVYVLRLPPSVTGQAAAVPGAPDRSLTTSATPATPATAESDWSLPPKAPPPVVAPCEPQRATELQKQWAEFLKRPVVEEIDVAEVVRLRTNGDNAPATPRTLTSSATANAATGDAGKLSFALIPPGEFEKTFTRGNDPTIESEMPVRRYRITRPFALATTEVTWEQFRVFVEATGYQTEAETNGVGGKTLDGKDDPNITWRTPGWKTQPNDPVTQVSLRDAHAFCAWLNLDCGDSSPLSHRGAATFSFPKWTAPPKNAVSPDNAKESGSAADQSGDKSPHSKSFRLPTEAEWLHACRAGSVHKHVVGPNPGQLVNYAVTSESAKFGDRPLSLTPVRSLKPNPFGLYDLLGNVAEYTHDYGHRVLLPYLTRNDPLGGFGPVARGGSWRDTRDKVHPDHALVLLSHDPKFAPIQPHVGFRVVQSFDAEPLPGPLDRPLQLQPGEPLSAHALVPRPAPIPGLRSWSVELAGPSSVTDAFVIAASSKGDLIATGGGAGAFGKITLWNRDGQFVRSLLGHEGGIASLDFSPDGRWLASVDDVPGTRGTGGSTARLWDVETGALHAVVPLPISGHCVTFAPNSDSLAIVAHGGGEHAGFLFQYEIGTSWLRGPIAGLAGAYGFAWSPDGNRFACSTGLGLAIRDAKTLRPLTELKTPRAPYVAWSPDGEWLAVSEQGNVAIRSAKTLELQRTFSGAHKFRWLSDSRRIAVCSPNGQPGIYDSTTGELVAAMKHHAYDCALLDNGNEVVTNRGNQSGVSIGFFDTATGTLKRQGPTPPNGGGEYSLLSPNGREVFASDGLGKFVRSTPQPASCNARRPCHSKAIASVPMARCSARSTVAEIPRRACRCSIFRPASENSSSPSPMPPPTKDFCTRPGRPTANAWRRARRTE